MTKLSPEAPRRHFRHWGRLARGAGPAAALLAILGGTASAQITAARYTGETDRYGHAILGDALEWTTLRLTLSDGRALTATLPDTMVFEDITPRLADVDGDGDPEVITIETSLTQGARLAIWDETGRLAATPFIGRSNRWLAPAGAVDLDGDGTVEIAYVDRPHLAKTLRVWHYRDGTLTEIARAQGLTNHKIGWDYIAGGARNCDGTAELILANANWTQTIAVTFDGSQLQQRRLGPYRSADDLNQHLNCS